MHITLFLITLSSLFFAILAAPKSYADQREYKGGLNHTYIRQSPPEPETTATAPTQTGEEAAPNTSVWEKYKALARGEAEQSKEQTTAPVKPTKPSLHQKQGSVQHNNQENTKSKATGFSGILEQYQHNKTQRSQMKSISIHKPETPKPSVTAPNKPIIETQSTN